jgi:hypothetical protein
VSEENVVRFHPSPRAGMARRGAPDKTQPEQSETVEVEVLLRRRAVPEAGGLALRPEICAPAATR